MARLLPLAKRKPCVNKRVWHFFYRKLVQESLYYQWQKVRFPVKPSHTFCGFPLHFSTTGENDVISDLASTYCRQRLAGLSPKD